MKRKETAVDQNHHHQNPNGYQFGNPKKLHHKHLKQEHKKSVIIPTSRGYEGDIKKIQKKITDNMIEDMRKIKLITTDMIGIENMDGLNLIVLKIMITDGKIKVMKIEDDLLILSSEITEIRSTMAKELRSGRRSTNMATEKLLEIIVKVRKKAREVIVKIKLSL